MCFGVSFVDYLGYRVSENGLQSLPKKVLAIQEAPAPNNAQEWAFLGLVTYYVNYFINQLSTITYPLNQLLKKGTSWVCNKACC